MRNYDMNLNIIMTSHLEIADSFLKRFIGLMGKKKLDCNSGLLIVPCQGVHTFFMRFPIDVVFLDKHNLVVYKMHNLKPYRLSPLIKEAHKVLELPAGMIKKFDISINEQIHIVKEN